MNQGTRIVEVALFKLLLNLQNRLVVRSLGRQRMEWGPKQKASKHCCKQEPHGDVDSQESA